ncbi:LysR family transcriptional regulator [Brucella endophytica]|uniref:LysR family transcriptional regulator n=1 Tax=Brucella endophytica TaxID=1963359 RepID=A0A916WBZ4_9HYPH|nr:LysR family transcriptional regulator [Brucella endophytica]GGA85584.1 LysR family transcriptional regulator [Brucella endophytica]
MKQTEWNSDINKTKDRGVDLNLLTVFQALMSEMNATKAAARLGVSQAAVSASLRRLRMVYDDPLFERTQRGLRPTPRAILLRPAIEEALQIIAGTLGGANPHEGEGAPVVPVRIGLSDDFEMAFGARILDLAKREMPHVRIVLRQTNSFVAAQAMHDREIDLAITSGRLGDERLKHLSLGSSDYLIVYDRRARSTDAPLTIEEYVASEHILVSYSGLRGIVDDVLAERGLRRSVRAATTHFSALPFLLRGTDAIATVPAHAARALRDLGPFALSACPLPFPRYAYGISWRFDAVRNPAIGRMRDLITAEFGQEAGL